MGDDGERTRDLLLANLPSDPKVGVFHGDFQTNNILFDDARLVAVVDWEISGIGAQLLDLGWLLMMNDPESWADGAPLSSVPPFEMLVDRYSEGVGRSVKLDESRSTGALGLSVRGHQRPQRDADRTGKRPDIEWERIARPVPLLFGRAADLLEGAR